MPFVNSFLCVAACISRQNRFAIINNLGRGIQETGLQPAGCNFFCMPKKTLLFCLPHAGGSAFFYQPLAAALPDWLHFVPLELPGRGRRAGEPLCSDFDRLTDDALLQMEKTLEEMGAARIVLFGHSMGALLAYSLAERLQQAPPSLLCLSAPPLPYTLGHSDEGKAKPVSTLPSRQLFSLLGELGGLPADVLSEPELISYIEPIIRSDFAALEHARPPLGRPLDVPFLLLGGEADKCSGSLYRWGARTTQSCRIRQFPGEHFYLLQHWAELAELIAGACSEE